jgi:hypothetical protein
MPSSGIKSEKIVGSAASGGAGAATATDKTNKAIVGKVIGVAVTYIGSPPATSDVVVKTAGVNHPEVVLLTLTNKNTDGMFQPFFLKDDDLGVDIAAEYVEPVIADQVIVDVAQANDNDSVNVVILYQE